jgi:hypothetical protein
MQSQETLVDLWRKRESFHEVLETSLVLCPHLVEALL